MKQEAEFSPEESPEESSFQLTRADMTAAAATENAEFQQAQINYLTNRVATLRAALNQTAAELARYKDAEKQKKAADSESEE